MSADQPCRRPALSPTGADSLITVVGGAPTAEELAAVVSVLLSRRRRRAAAPQPASAWVRGARPGGVTPSGLVTPPRHGGWRESALPR